MTFCNPNYLPKVSPLNTPVGLSFHPLNISNTWMWRLNALHEFWGTNHTRVIAGSCNYDRHSSDICGLSARNRHMAIQSSSPRSISWPQANCFITPLKTCETPASILQASLVLFPQKGHKVMAQAKRSWGEAFLCLSQGCGPPSMVPPSSSSSVAWELVRNGNSQAAPKSTESEILARASATAALQAF